MARLTMALSVALLLVVNLSPTTTAGVISVDDASFGVGALTRDTDQGLDFLDLAFSLDRTFDSVSTQFGLGGDFEGFRYATEIEVLTLVNNFGFLPTASSGTTTTGDGTGTALIGLVDMLTATYFDNNFNVSVGYTGTDSDFPGGKRAISIRGEFSTPFDEVSADVAFNGSFVQDPTIGSFLVRSYVTTVPEPGSVTLLGGLLGLGLIGRRGSLRNARKTCKNFFKF